MMRTGTDDGSVVSASNEQSGRRAPSRYDLVLGAIPLLLGTSAVGAFVGDLPSEPLLAAAAIVCMAAIADVLFVHPPLDVSRRDPARDEEPEPHRTRRRRTG